MQMTINSPPHTLFPYSRASSSLLEAEIPTHHYCCCLFTARHVHLQSAVDKRDIFLIPDFLILTLSIRKTHDASSSKTLRSTEFSGAIISCALIGPILIEKL